MKWSTRFQSWGLHADDCPCPDCCAYWAGDATLAAKLEAQARADYAQELLAARVTSDEFDREMARLYPNVIGNGHPDVCLCPFCAPGEYEVPENE